MNISLQAAGGRVSEPADPNHPWRVLVFEQHQDGFWTLSSIFEMSTFDIADMTGMEICTEPYDAGVIAMHYVVGRAL